MTAPLLELETITVSGDASALGRAQGETLRELIQAFVAQRFAAVDPYARERGALGGLSLREALANVAHESVAIHQRWDPDGYAEHVGIAEGAGLDPIDLYITTNMTDMRDAVLLSAASGPPLESAILGPEGCSAVLLPGSVTDDGAPIAAQTWDLNPPDVRFVVAVHRQPSDGPETWSLTCAGCLSLIGINEQGLAVGTTNIKTYGSRPGVGYLGILHRALRAASANEASELVRTAPHAGAHTYWIADPEQQFEWEASPNQQHRRDTRAGPIWRTNHCLLEQHQHIEGELPSASSQRRFERIDERVSGNKLGVSELRTLFSDRRDGAQSINRYPEDDQGTATNGVFIALPQQRRAFACRGPADRGRWTELQFGEPA